MAAFALTVVGYNAAQGPVLTLPAAFLSGRSSAIGYAVITGVGVLGGFIGPAFMGWARDFTGGYQRGLLLAGGAFGDGGGVDLLAVAEAGCAGSVGRYSRGRPWRPTLLRALLDLLARTLRMRWLRRGRRCGGSTISLRAGVRI